MTSPGYDYVVVGGGTSGPVLAARLAEDPELRVLLLEAGRSQPGDWGLTTVPQPGLDGRTIAWPRGKGVGGSSALAPGSWIRGNRLDYDDWAEHGGSGWSHATLLPLFRRAEDSGRGPAPWRGVGGPVALAEPDARGPAHDALEQAVEQAGFGGRTDVNGPHQFGSDVPELTRTDRTPAAGYLAAAGPNLEVRTGAHVTRILFEGDRAVGVLVDGEPVRADREVILAAGAVGTPHLLLLSGIGPAAHLADHGITTVADVPGVGGNLHDHLRVPFHGSAATGLAGGVVFLRTDEEYCAPDLELLLGDDARLPAPVVLQPQSRGTVRLASADPAVAPLIDPAYLAEPEDLAALLHGLRAALWISEQDALRPYADTRPLSPDATDAELTAHIRATADTAHHPVGTARLGRPDDPDAVLDDRLRVRGVTGLRVADLSAAPTITRGHAMAPAVVIAERAADLILADLYWPLT